MGATVHGTVKGYALNPSDAISAEAVVNLGFGTLPTAAIVLSDAGHLCGKADANVEPKSAGALVFFLDDVTGPSITAAAGTGAYPVYVTGSGQPGPRIAYASFGYNDATCKETLFAQAVSGAVTLTANRPGVYAGTFDLTFDSGDHVTGTFETAGCPSLGKYLLSTNQTCG